MVPPRFFDAKFGEKRAVRSAVTTAEALARDADVVVVTAGSPPRYERLTPHLVIYRLWDLYLPDPVNYGIAPGILPSLLRIIRTEQPDAYLINKHMFSTSLAAPFLRLLGKRVIVQTDTFPGINWFPRNRLVNLVMRLYAWTVGLLVLKSAHHVVLLHEGLVPVAKRLGLPYQVIHNGVDLQAFDAFRPAPDLPKRRGEIFIGYVGRLESVKGYDDFVAAAEVVVGTHPNVTVFLVGNTDGQESFVAAHQSERIRFLGHRSDVPAVLKHFDIFVIPSYSEGLPNALMEAMAAGCACVASEVGGMTILLGGGIGCFIRPGDRAALASELERLIGDPTTRRRLGSAARLKIEADFDLQRESQKLLALLVRP